MPEISANPADRRGTITGGVDWRAYEKIEAVNFSTLKDLRRSAAHYRHSLLHPREDTDAMRMGRCIHAATLEPDRFQSRCALWTGLKRAGKKWEKFCDDNGGREILRKAEWDQCLAVQRAVRSHPAAADLLKSGRAEVTIEWADSETGIKCKARIDYLADAISDLKTCKDASPVTFGRTAWRLAYHTQAAWYQEAVRAATGRLLPFSFIAAEVEEPHVVQVYNVPEHVLDIGREEFRGLLRALAAYRERDQWPGYSDDGAALELSLPRWAVDADEENLGELDLAIGG